MSLLRIVNLSCIFLLLFLTACSDSEAFVKSEQQKGRDAIISFTKNELKADADIADKTDDEYATYFVVVADTGNNYYSLRNKMFQMNKQLALPIDTLGRSYNQEKNLIALPDSAEDEIYAGDYFPRRYPSDHLSLEYLAVYKPSSAEKTMALVTGIYENETGADSALAILKKADSRFFKLKSKIYVGCTH